MTETAQSKTKEVKRMLSYMNDQYQKMKEQRMELSSLEYFDLQLIFNKIADRHKDLMTSGDITRALR